MQDLLQLLCLYVWGRCLQLLPRFNFLANEMQFSFNMFWYIAPFMYPSVTCNAPVPFAEMWYGMLGIISTTFLSPNMPTSDLSKCI